MPDQFKDPDWWFMALFVVILASLGVSYLGDAISSLLARFSPAFRERRGARLSRDRQRVALLAANPELLLMELIRCLFLIVLFMGLVGFYLFFALLSAAMARVPEIHSGGVLTLGLLAKASLVIGAALGLCSIYFGSPIASRLQTVMRAKAEYENRCKRRREEPSAAASRKSGDA